MLVRGRAVARITSTPNPACLIELAPSGPQTLSVTGNGSLTLNSCVAVANSTNPQSIYVKGSGSLNARCSYTGSGTAYAQKPNSLVSQCDPEVQQDTVQDPYAAVPAPTKSATCYSPKGNQPAIPLSPTRTVDGLKIWDLCALAVRGTVNLQPGLYILYGGNLTTQGQSKLMGEGVTIISLVSRARPPFTRASLSTHWTWI